MGNSCPPRSSSARAHADAHANDHAARAALLAHIEAVLREAPPTLRNALDERLRRAIDSTAPSPDDVAAAPDAVELVVDDNAPDGGDERDDALSTREEADTRSRSFTSDLRSLYLRQLDRERRNLTNVHTRRLQRIEPTSLDGVGSLSGEDLIHMTALVCESDRGIVLLSLHVAAGSPDHVPGRGFQRSRCETWSIDNLQALDYPSLLALQPLAASAGYVYRPNLPLNVLSLHTDPRATTRPHDYLYAADMMRIQEGNAGTFLLDMVALPGDTGLATAGEFGRLRALVFGDSAQERFHPLSSSPLSFVTLPEAARARAAIPQEAAFYCFVHAPAGAEHVTPAAIARASLRRSNPLIEFLLNGGYVYFNYEYDALQINAITFDEVPAASATLFFGQPSPLPLAAAQQLYEDGRFKPLPPSHARRAYGFTEFAWIHPSALVKGTLFCRSGGFAFLHPDDYTVPDAGRPHLISPEGVDGKSRFFPVVRNAPLTHPVLKVKKPSSGAPGEVLCVPRESVLSYPYPADFLHASNFPRTVPKDFESELFIAELSGVEAPIRRADRAAAVAPLSTKYLDAGLGGSLDLAFAPGQAAARGLHAALGFSHANIVQTLQHELKLSPERVREVAEQRGCSLMDAGELEVLRLETERLTAARGGGEIPPSYSLDHLVEAGALHVFGTTAEYLSELLANMRYVLDGKASETRLTGNDGSTARRDSGHGGMRLADFQSAPTAVIAGLSLAEVAALRLYTSSSYRVVNGPLRKAAVPHPLAATVYFISSALKKMRALHMQGDARFQTRYLWRGMRDRTVGNTFLARGGTELACMSTSEDLNVVASYAMSEAPLLFRIKIESPMELGASVKWLSFFPDEEEWLYPPLTYLRPLCQQRILNKARGVVVTVKPSFPT